MVAEDRRICLQPRDLVSNSWYVIAGVSNSIHQKTLRGGANFLVVSPDVATIIESIPGYASSADNGDAQFAFGVTKVGSLE